MNRCTHAVTCLFLVIVGLFSTACAAPLKPGDENNDALMADRAGDFWGNKNWMGGTNPDHARKIAIVEFNVEFLTADQMQLVDGSNIGSAMGAGLAVAQVAGAGKTTYVYDKGFQQALPGDMYEVFVQRLAHAGFVVVPKNQVVGSVSYKALIGTTDAKDTGKSGGGTISESQIFPAPGFIRQQAGLFGLNLFDDISNNQNITKLTSEVGAESAAVVLIRLGIDDDGKPTIAPGSKITLYSSLDENWGSNPKTYHFKNSQLLLGKAGLGYGENVLTSQGSALGKGDIMSVDSAKYRSTILAIFPVHAALAAQKLK